MDSNTLFTGRGDAASWGIADFYDDCEQKLREALSSGENFDTGWYSVKKELQSGRVQRVRDLITCEASCTDDFDTEGYGTISLIFPSSEEAAFGNSYDDLVDMMCNAMTGAESNRLENRCYIGFSIGQIDRIDTNSTIKFYRENNQGMTCENWLHTYIAPIGDGAEMEFPPGDCYSDWGWQDEAEGSIPERVKSVFEEWVNKFVYDPNKDDYCTYSNWRIDPWRG